MMPDENGNNTTNATNPTSPNGLQEASTTNTPSDLSDLTPPFSDTPSPQQVVVEDDANMDAIDSLLDQQIENPPQPVPPDPVSNNPVNLDQNNYFNNLVNGQPGVVQPSFDSTQGFQSFDSAQGVPPIDQAQGVPPTDQAVPPPANYYPSYSPFPETPPASPVTPAEPVMQEVPTQEELNTVVQSEPIIIDEEPKKSYLPKKLIVILGIVFGGLLILLLLTRLFGKKGGTGGGVPSTPGNEIVWWGLWEDASIIQPLIDEYQSVNKGVKIKYIKNSNQDYRERLSNSLAKNEGPDIFYYHNSWVPMFVKNLDVMPETVMTPQAFTEKYYPVISKNLILGKSVVGIPLGYEALTMYVNDDLFIKGGVNPPLYWEELRATACKLTKIENEKIVQAGVALGRTENIDHWQDILGLMFAQNNVDFGDPKGQVAEDAIRYYARFSMEDLACDKSSVKVWDETLPPSTEMFLNGKLAMYFGPSWRALYFKEKNPKLNFKTVALPQLPKESVSEPDVSYATYWVQGVNKNSKKKADAWKFLAWMGSKETQEKFFQKATQARGFGEAYPDVKMGDVLQGHPILGSVVKLAPYAKSWYLASRTFDGSSGINTLIGKYFEDGIIAINQGKDAKAVMTTINQGVLQIYTQYGITKSK